MSDTSSNEPKVIKSGKLCTLCGSWMPIEKHGTYCKARILSDGFTHYIEKSEHDKVVDELALVTADRLDMAEKLTAKWNELQTLLHGKDGYIANLQKEIADARDELKPVFEGWAKIVTTKLLEVIFIERERVEGDCERYRLALERIAASRNYNEEIEIAREALKK